MVAPIKKQIVDELREKLEGKEAIFLTDFTGISVNDLRKIRVELRNLNSEFRVVKNRLFKRVLQEKVEDFPEEILRGNTAIVLPSGNIVDTAKVLKESSKTFETFKIKGGFLNWSFLDKKKILELASLPGREQLISNLLGLMLSPVKRFVNVLSGNIRNLVIVLDQISKQKEN